MTTKRERLKDQIIKHLKRRRTGKSRSYWWLMFSKPIEAVAEDMINDYWPQLNENNIHKEIPSK